MAAKKVLTGCRDCIKCMGSGVGAGEKLWVTVVRRSLLLEFARWGSRIGSDAIRLVKLPGYSAPGVPNDRRGKNV